MKSFIILVLSLTSTLPVSSQTESVETGRYSNELWDMFWLVSPARLAPKSQQKGRVVSFNIEAYTDITKASLEYDFFDGDFLVNEPVSMTGFKILIDGQEVDRVENATNTIFVHRSVDISAFVQNRFVVAVIFERVGGNDGVVIGKVHLNIEGTVTAIGETRSIMVNSYSLKDNYPNPFNNKTLIEYDLLGPGHVVVEIYDILGNKVKTLVNDFQISGTHRINWDGRDQNDNQVASQQYYYTLKIDNNIQTKKMLLIK